MKNPKFLELVTTPEEVAENIRRYNAALKKDARLIERMPYARAWYALQTDDGYLLAPSKVIGYKDFDPDVYFANENKDGRKTEARLQSMSTLADVCDPKTKSEMFNALSKLLASFDHSPNSSARISLLAVRGDVPEHGDPTHIQAIIELVLRLPPASIDIVKRRIAAL